MTTEVRDTRLMEILREQIEVEKETFIELEKAEASAQEAAVRLVFMEMRLDTMKHQKFLEGLLEMMTETPCDRWSAKVQRYVDRVKLTRQLESFISQEAKMLRLLEQAIEEMEDSLGTLLLQHLKEDEEKHHFSLQEINRLVQKQPLQSVKGKTGADIVCENPD